MAEVFRQSNPGKNLAVSTNPFLFNPFRRNYYFSLFLKHISSAKIGKIKNNFSLQIGGSLCFFSRPVGLIRNSGITWFSCRTIGSLNRTIQSSNQTLQMSLTISSSSQNIQRGSWRLLIQYFIRWIRVGCKSLGFLENLEGVKGFIEQAVARGATFNGLLKCPCIICNNVRYEDRETTYHHMICNGIDQNYKIWGFQGEDLPQTSSTGDAMMDNASNEMIWVTI